MIFTPLIIWAKALFFYEQLFPVVARTWWAPRSDRLLLGPKFRFLVQKSDFCHTIPILVNDPFLALTMTVNFPPWERFFDFLFRSYSCFRKKIRLTALLKVGCSFSWLFFFVVVLFRGCSRTQNTLKWRRAYDIETCCCCWSVFYLGCLVTMFLSKLVVLVLFCSTA